MHTTLRTPLGAGARALGAAALLFAGLAAWSPAHAATPSCASEKGVKLICGVNNVEDWAPISGTHWVIGSDLTVPGKQGTLYLFDTKNDTASAVQPDAIAIKPDKAKYQDCPGAPDMKVFGPHGLDLTGTGAQRTLYAINHGGREAVEVFDVNVAKDKPAFTWVGCVTAPKGTYPDAVAVLPHGDMIVTSLWDPTDPQRMDKLSHGKPVGALLEWSQGKGWSEVPGSQGLSAPNGVITSPDGKMVFVAASAGREVARIDLDAKPPKKDTVDVGFFPDNLRWSPDGKTIYVGGQDAPLKQVLACFESSDANCPNVPFKIDALDPNTMKLTILVKTGVYGGMGAGTGAIKVGNKLWISTFRADRVAILPMK